MQCFFFSFGEMLTSLRLVIFLVYCSLLRTSIMYYQKIYSNQYQLLKNQNNIHLSKQFDFFFNNNNVAVEEISKDDLVLTCGVAFLEIEWTSGSLFY
jgi:uncharacterized membrane protein YqhA